MNASGLSENKKFTAAVFLCVFLVMLFLAWCTPLAGDDFIYAFNDNSTVKPLNLTDIFRSIRLQRVTTSARFISHFFVEYFIMKGKWIFNIANALVNTCSLYVLFCFFRNEHRRNTILLLFGVFLLWIFMPVFGEVYLWLDGACNYSWAMAFLLVFIFPYYSEFVRQKGITKPFGKALWFLASLIFGAYSENGSAAGIMAAFFLMLFLLVRSKRTGRKLPVYLPVGFLLCCSGYLFLVSSPVIMDKGSISTEKILSVFSKLFGAVSSVVSRVGFPLFFGAAFFAVLFLGFAVYVLKRRKHFKLLVDILCFIWAAAVVFFAFRAVRGASAPVSGNAAKAALASMALWKALLFAMMSEPMINLISISMIFLLVFLSAIYYRTDRKKILSSAVFAASGLASAAVFVFAIYRPARSCCYFVLLLVTAILILLSDLSEKFSRPLKRVLAGLLIIAFVFCFAFGLADNISVKRQDIVIQQQILEAASEGKNRIELHPYEYLTKYSALYGIDNIATEYCWLNHYMGMYYGFEELVGIAG